MSDLPFAWMNPFFAVPKTGDQNINPGWFDINVTNYAGNPQVEKEVVEKVASFGMQLGILTEAILSLAGDPPKAGEDPIARLREMDAKIEAIKAQNKTSLADQAETAMKRLAKLEPDEARRIASEYIRNGSA